jgi:hypothetical protein
MDRGLFPEGVAVERTDLTFVVDTFIRELEERRVASRAPTPDGPVVGLELTAVASAGCSVAPGYGYTPRGDRVGLATTTGLTLGTTAGAYVVYLRAGESDAESTVNGPRRRVSTTELCSLRLGEFTALRPEVRARVAVVGVALVSNPAALSGSLPVVRMARRAVPAGLTAYFDSPDTVPGLLVLGVALGDTADPIPTNSDGIPDFSGVTFEGGGLPGDIIAQLEADPLEYMCTLSRGSLLLTTAPADPVDTATVDGTEFGNAQPHVLTLTHPPTDYRNTVTVTFTLRVLPGALGAGESQQGTLRVAARAPQLLSHGRPSDLDHRAQGAGLPSPSEPHGSSQGRSTFAAGRIALGASAAGSSLALTPRVGSTSPLYNGAHSPGHYVLLEEHWHGDEHPVAYRKYAFQGYTTSPPDSAPVFLPAGTCETWNARYTNFDTWLPDVSDTAYYPRSYRVYSTLSGEHRIESALSNVTPENGIQWIQQFNFDLNGGRFTTRGAVTIEDSLTTKEDMTVEGHTYLAGLSVADSVRAEGYGIFRQDLTVEGDARVEGDLDVGGLISGQMHPLADIVYSSFDTIAEQYNEPAVTLYSTDANGVVGSSSQLSTGNGNSNGPNIPLGSTGYYIMRPTEPGREYVWVGAYRLPTVYDIELDLSAIMTAGAPVGRRTTLTWATGHFTAIPDLVEALDNLPGQYVQTTYAPIYGAFGNGRGFLWKVANRDLSAYYGAGAQNTVAVTMMHKVLNQTSGAVYVVARGPVVQINEGSNEYWYIYGHKFTITRLPNQRVALPMDEDNESLGIPWAPDDLNSRTDAVSEDPAVLYLLEAED